MTHKKPFLAVLSVVVAAAVTAGGAAAAAAQKQVTGLTARHQAGQTMLAWQEVDSPATDPAIAAVKLRELRRDLDKSKKVRYRIYRAERKITSLQGLRPIAEVPPLSGWNIDYYGDLRPEHQALRYVIEEGKGPVPPGTGIYAHNPKKAGTAYYAVTLSIDGKENTAPGAGQRAGRADCGDGRAGHPRAAADRKAQRVAVRHGPDAPLLRPLGIAAQLRR